MSGWKEPDVEKALTAKLMGTVGAVTAGELMAGFRAKIRDEATTTPRVDHPAHPLPKHGAPRRELAAALRAKPGRWHLLGAYHSATCARTFSYEIRKGGHGWTMFGPGFEAETHTMLGQHRIYARWVGGAA